MNFIALYEQHLYSRRLSSGHIDGVTAILHHFAHWTAEKKNKPDARDVVLRDVLDYHEMLRQRKEKLTRQPVSAA